jgi:capsular exopolysaccharide synthesis family protein
MELQDYITPLRRWWWLILASLAIATISAYFATRDLPPVYMARATLLVGTALKSSNATGDDFGASRPLATAYAEIGRREKVAIAVMAKFGLKEMPDYDVNPSVDGQFIDIAVTDINPELAQAVANEIADQLILQTPSSSQSESAEVQAFVAQQIRETQQSIIETKDEIQAKQALLATISSAAALEATKGEIQTLEQRLDALQNNFASLISNTREGATNRLEFFERASLPNPDFPVGPNKLLIVLLAAMGGLVLSVGAAYIIEFLDDTIKSTEEVTRLFPFPTIGFLGELERGKDGTLSVADRPRSSFAETFRSLRTNLEFASVDRPLKTLLVTSAMPGDGKSSTAFNLALIIAQRGKKVVLIDADLRKPKIHTLLGVPNRDGLSDLFLGQVSVQDVIRPWRVDNVFAITSGTPPPNPTELLGSKRMEQILADLQERFDIVIVDGPPFFVADSWVLSSKVNGMLVITQPGHTRRSAARAMVEQIRRVSAPVIGVAINRLNRIATPDSRYTYLSYYYDHENDKRREVSGSKPGLKLPSFFKQPLKQISNGKNGHAKPSAHVRPTAIEAPATADDVQPEEAGVRVEAPVVETTPVGAVTPERESDRSQASLRLLYDLSQELNTPLELTQLLKRILQMTVTSLEAESGSIMILDDAGNPVKAVGIYNDKFTSKIMAQASQVVEHGLTGWVIENKRPVVLENTFEDARWMRGEHDDAPRSVASVPLMSDDRVSGVMTLANGQVGYFTRDDLSMLTAIAVGVSNSIARAREIV